MEFDKVYKELWESFLRDADPDSQRVRGGRRAEDLFFNQITQSGKYKIKKATDIEDKTERWDFKLYEDMNGKFIPAFPTNALNTQNPTIPKLKGTVDVKSRGLTGEYSIIWLVAQGRGTAWCRGVNWIAVPEGATFRLIHCNSLMHILKRHAHIEVRNPEDTNATIVSNDTSRPIRFTPNYNEVDVGSGLLYINNDTNSKGILAKTSTLKAISILL
jgi:hypothetical protein